MNKETNSLNWFEIPVQDIARAARFYEKIFSIKMDVLPDMMGMKMTSFPADMGNGKVSGALVQGPMHIPSKEGCVIYLNANPDMQEVIDRIVEAHGTVVMPRTQISPEIGFMAFFIDTEGNKIGLHAQN
jgi:predicted enzyme related to lactoylglutathione lyase